MGKPRGKPTQGSRFLFKHNDEWKRLEGLSGMGDSSVKVDKIEVTDFESEAKEYIAGSKEYESFNLTGQYLPKADAPNQALLESLAGKDAIPVRLCLVDDFDRTKFTVKEGMASVGSFKVDDAKTFDKQTFSCTMEPSGAMVRHDAVPVANLMEESLTP